MLTTDYKAYIPQIAFEITSDCNYNCVFCYNYWKHSDNKYAVPKNSFETAQHTLTQLFKIANVRNITFVGGEPTLSEKFEDVITFCIQQNVNVSIVSNGSLTNENTYKRLINLGVSLFEIPIFSVTPEIHDEHTQVKNSWNNALKSIDYIIKNKGKIIPIIVITKKNYFEIGTVVKLLIDKGITQIFLNRFNIGGAGVKVAEALSPDLKELKDTLFEINTLANQFNINVLSMVSIPQCLINQNDYPNIQFNYCPANVLNRPLTIDITGNLRICNHSPRIIGNIFLDEIEQLLTSEYVNSWNKIKPPFCADCNKFERCLAGCRAASEQLGYGLDKEDPIIKIMRIE